jgi:glycopeptide antibiotics resistance protein
MTARAKVETVVIYVVFALYVAFLLKLLLFSRPLGAQRSINLIPFAGITHYLTGASPRTALGNVAGNVLIFIPVGAYLAFLRSRATIVKNVLVIVAASVVVEIIQGIFAVGSSDIDDVILNSVGGFAGILFVKLLTSTLRRGGRVRKIIAVLSLVLAPVTCYLLFFIRLRM